MEIQEGKGPGATVVTADNSCNPALGWTPSGWGCCTPMAAHRPDCGICPRVGPLDSFERLK